MISFPLLSDTSGRRYDGAVSPVVERGESDPRNHAGGWKKPSAEMTTAIHGGFSREFPKSGQIHYY